jgi:hypothetical protein
MTFDDFINQYDGKGINFDGAYGNQCVDLYRQFVKDVCGVPQSPSVAGAKNIWDTYLALYFDRIANTPTGVPEKGDIVIWGSLIGTYGHVAVFIAGDATNFTSFDQNWPDAGGKGVAHKQTHTYKGVLGWLRLKKPAAPAEDPRDGRIRELESQLAAANAQAVDRTDLAAKVENLQQQSTDKDTEVEMLHQEVDRLSQTNEQLATKITELEGIIEGLEKPAEVPVIESSPEPAKKTLTQIVVDFFNSLIGKNK